MKYLYEKLFYLTRLVFPLTVMRILQVEQDKELIRLRQALNRTLQMLNEATKQANAAKQAVSSCIDHDTLKICS